MTLYYIMLYDLRCYNHNAQCQCQTELDRDQKQPATDMRMYALPGRGESVSPGSEGGSSGTSDVGSPRIKKEKKSKEQDD